MNVQPRLVSLDFLRGFTVAGMILVNNGGHDSFALLRHARWDGLTLSDLVFPFFLFIMGVSMFVSFSRKGFVLDRASFLKIAKRTLLLFILGLTINFIDMAPWGEGHTISDLRFWAVLQRIAICYFLVSMFVLTCNHRLVLPTAVALLAAYAVIITLGHGYSTDPSVNILHRIDALTVGDAHMYHKSPVDPEGLAGTLGALVNVLLGFFCAMLFSRRDSVAQKVRVFTRAGVLIWIAGFVLSIWFPVNKRVWSPSFALVTSGLCALLLAAAMFLIDEKRDTAKLRVHNPAVTFFLVFGVNALALYISSELLTILFSKTGVSDFIYSLYSSVIGVGPWAALAYALTFVGLNFLIGYPLWRRRIFIKL